MPEVPSRVRVRVEVPRWSVFKREEERIEYVSPVPCPFNYGCVPDRPAPDGDALDALVLGARLPLGADVEVPVQGVVRFRDAGEVDDKLVCGRPPSAADRLLIVAFFRSYAVARRAMNRLRGLPGTTRYEGFERGPVRLRANDRTDRALRSE